MSTSIKTRIKALEVALSAKANQFEIVGFQVTSYADWPDPVPASWHETFPGSEIWITPA